MAKKGSNIRRISDKKKNKPKIRFNIWMMIIIFALSFSGCFILYMAAANIDDDFLNDEFGNTVFESSVVDESSVDQEITETPTNAADVSEPDQLPKAAYPVAGSDTVDMSYLDTCCLVTDSTLIPMKYYTELTDLVGNETLTTVAINESKVQSNYGTVTVSETLKLKKPMNIYIMLGSDIGVSSVDDMISAYSTFVADLKSALPGTKIYIMQYPPVYQDSETVTNAMINEYNDKLLAIAKSLEVYCIDTSTDFKQDTGALKEEYWLAEDGKKSGVFYTDVCGYILTHTVQ